MSKDQYLRGDQGVRGGMGHYGIRYLAPPVHRPGIKHPRHGPGQPASVQGAEQNGRQQKRKPGKAGGELIEVG